MELVKVMTIQISKSDVIWSYLGYILKVSSNLILLPVILRHLTSEELGCWYVFLSIGALVQLMDLGFTPTIMRNISYAFSGATCLKKEGIFSRQKLTQKPNYELIYKLKYLSKKLYMYISIVAFLLLMTIGSCYLFFITEQLESGKIFAAWSIYVVAIFVNCYYSYWIPVLSGIGKIKESQQAIVISQLGYIFVGYAGLAILDGISALAVAFLISGIVQRWFSKHYFMKNTIEHKVKMSQEEYQELFQVIWHTARKMGLVSVGAFLILQANTLICSTYFDLKTTAQYGLTLQVITVISVFSATMFRSYLPSINEARITNDQEKLKRHLALTTIVGWSTFLLCAILLILFGDAVLGSIGSKTSLLPQNMLILMVIYLFLEFNHSNFATFIVTNNEVPFVKASIYSGIAILILSLIFINFTGRSLWCLLISQAVVQLTYNNWKWPMVVMQQLNMQFWDIFRLGLKK